MRGCLMPEPTTGRFVHQEIRTYTRRAVVVWLPEVPDA